MDLFLARFTFDVTPPVGHPLCGGWIKPVEAVDDSLEAKGLILLGAEAPIVLVAVDWTGIQNGTHRLWRRTLADAVHTTPDRVAIHTVHQHNAPFACLEAQSFLDEVDGLPITIDRDFHAQVLERATQAARNALARTERLTGIATGKAKVDRVASNRRFLGPDGKVLQWRGSSTKDAALRELPEGLIDPDLRTIALYSGSTKLAAIHTYATHPMSYYGDGRVTSDFVGLARKRREAEEPGVMHLYWTGCSGNVAAGKYNDGSHQARLDLTDRIHDAMRRSEEDLRPSTLSTVSWSWVEKNVPPRPTLDPAELHRRMRDAQRPLAERMRAAYMLAFVARAESEPLPLAACLSLNEAKLLFLPGESFVEYQLFASQTAPDAFVCTAAYGDDGPWYIPVHEAYEQGGYEVGVAFADSAIDPLLRDAIRACLG